MTVKVFANWKTKGKVSYKRLILMSRYCPYELNSHHKEFYSVLKLLRAQLVLTFKVDNGYLRG